MELLATTRTIIGKATNTLRSEGLIPAVIYGRGFESKNLSVSYVAFAKVYKEAGESSLVDLVIDNANSIKVLIQDIAKDPISGKALHVDFHQVSMTEKITTEIPLKFIGESRAVKELAGILVKNMNALKVRCLPGDLVSEIEVDLSPLVDFGSMVHVSDIKIPKGLEVLGKVDEAIVSIEEPRKEEELAGLNEKVEENIEAVKVATDEKKAEREQEKAAEEK